MDEAASKTLEMPDRSQRVREALLRFETLTTRPSTMMALSDEQLYEIGLLLSDRELSIADALRESNASLGLEEPITRRTFYRFADKFKKLLGQVTAEYAQRCVRLTVANATDDNIAKLNRVSRHRYAELLAEKLVDTDDLVEIERYMGKMSSFLAEAERARQADERIELDQLDYERRLSDTRSKLDLSEHRVEQMKQDAADKKAKINERLSQLQTQIDGLLKRASRGQQITADHLRHANADLAALREEAA